jgi:ABC-type amino acid transport substrate-binding protein
MSKKLGLLALMFLTWAASAHASEPAFDRVIKSKTINCGYFFWPTYLDRDANTGAFSGLNYEIMEAIGKNLGLKINWSAEIGVGDPVAALEAGKADVVCASVWPSPARTQNMLLSNPSFYSAVFTFARGDDKRFDGALNKANNKDMRVSAIDGDYSYDLAAEKLPAATIVALPQTASGSELLLQVVSKKADVFFSDEGMVNAFLKTNPGSLRRIDGIGPVRYYGETLPVERGEYQLKNMLDTAITQLTNDGVITAIVEKYKDKYHANWYPPAKTLDLK